MAKLRYPTWQDVNMPKCVINMIENAQNTSTIMYLVEHRIMHFENPVYYKYVCADCGYARIPEKVSDDYVTCDKCKLHKINSMPYHTYSRKHPQGKLDRETASYQIVEKMKENFGQYFGVITYDDFSLKFDANYGFVSRFPSGDEAHAVSPFVSIAKAALLCPYIWDPSFNWASGIKNDYDESFSLAHALYQWVS